MNIHAPISEVSKSNMTRKGQVLIPKALRDRAGLTPGGEVTIGMNDRGQIVVLPAASTETRDERTQRIRAAIESVRGTLDTGFASTDEYMDFVRPHRREDW